MKAQELREHNFSFEKLFEPFVKVWSMQLGSFEIFWHVLFVFMELSSCWYKKVPTIFHLLVC